MNEIQLFVIKFVDQAEIYLLTESTKEHYERRRLNTQFLILKTIRNR